MIKLGENKNHADLFPRKKNISLNVYLLEFNVRFLVEGTGIVIETTLACNLKLAANGSDVAREPLVLLEFVY